MYSDYLGSDFLKKKTASIVIASILLIAILIVIFIFKTNNKIYIPQSYSADFTLDSDIGDISGSFDKKRDCISISLVSPQLLDGLEIKLSKDEYSFCYQGLSVEQSVIPDFAKEYVSSLFTVIDGMQYLSIEKSRGDYTITEFDVGNTTAKCYFNNKTETPVKLEISGLGSISITNFTAIK